LIFRAGLVCSDSKQAVRKRSVEFTFAEKFGSKLYDACVELADEAADTGGAHYEPRMPG
jgi:hypothetical protein